MNITACVGCRSTKSGGSYILGFNTKYKVCSDCLAREIIIKPDELAKLKHKGEQTKYRRRVMQEIIDKRLGYFERKVKKEESKI